MKVTTVMAMLLILEIVAYSVLVICVGYVAFHFIIKYW